MRKATRYWQRMPRAIECAWINDGVRRRGGSQQARNASSKESGGRLRGLLSSAIFGGVIGATGVRAWHGRRIHAAANACWRCNPKLGGCRTDARSTCAPCVTAGAPLCRQLQLLSAGGQSFLSQVRPSPHPSPQLPAFHLHLSSVPPPFHSVAHLLSRACPLAPDSLAPTSSPLAPRNPHIIRPE